MKKYLFVLIIAYLVIFLVALVADHNHKQAYFYDGLGGGFGGGGAGGSW